MTRSTLSGDRGFSAAGFRTGADGGSARRLDDGGVSITTKRSKSLVSLSAIEKPATPVSLETLTAAWRLALDAAEDALRAAGASGLSRLDAAELHECSVRLGRERDSIARILDAIAHERHISVRRPVVEGTQFLPEREEGLPEGGPSPARRRIPPTRARRSGARPRSPASAGR